MSKEFFKFISKDVFPGKDYEVDEDFLMKNVWGFQRLMLEVFSEELAKAIRSTNRLDQLTQCKN